MTASSPHRTPLHALVRIGTMCALVVIPVWFMATQLELAAIKGTQWYNPDPDWPYFGSAINLAMGRTPSNNDHPGLGVKYIAAATMHVVHALSGTHPLPDDVFIRPALFTYATGVAIILLFTLMHMALGWMVWRATGDVMIALVSQFAAFLVLINGYYLFLMVKICAEPVIVTAAMAMGASCLPLLKREDKKALWWACVGSAACVGYGIATKFNFIPLAIFPFIVLPGIRFRALYLVFLGFFTALFLAPTLIPVPNELAVLFARSLMPGAHSGGSGSLLDVPFARILKIYIAQDRQFFALLGLGWGVLVFGVLAKFVAKRPVSGASIRFAAAALIAATVQILAVAKNEMCYYYMPALGLAGCVFAGVAVVMVEVAGAGKMRHAIRACVWVLGIAYCLYYVGDAKRMLAKTRESQVQFRQQYQPFYDRLLTMPPCDAVVYDEDARSRSAGIGWGERHSGGRFTATLQRLYPDTYLYRGYMQDQNKRYVWWYQDIAPMEIVLKYTNIYFVTGTNYPASYTPLIPLRPVFGEGDRTLSVVDKEAFLRSLRRVVPASLGVGDASVSTVPFVADECYDWVAAGGDGAGRIAFDVVCEKPGKSGVSVNVASTSVAAFTVWCNGVAMSTNMVVMPTHGRYRQVFLGPVAMVKGVNRIEIGTEDQPFPRFAGITVGSECSIAFARDADVTNARADEAVCGTPATPLLVATGAGEARASFAVYARTAGVYGMSCACAARTQRTMEVSVNNGQMTNVTIDATGGNAVRHVKKRGLGSAMLVAGTNTVMVSSAVLPHIASLAIEELQ